jgi:hypothetical protein
MRMMRRLTPFGAIVRGLVAGAVGSFVQSRFFRATAGIAPAPPPDAFVPPEPVQRSEAATETVARRWVDYLMQRGPLSSEDKSIAGQVVRYAFGAGWGADYAVARETIASVGSPRGALAFGTGVWLVSDNLILPAFRLAAWPRAYPVKNHAYALAAHLAYGLSVAATYEILRRPPAMLGALLVAAAPAVERLVARARRQQRLAALRDVRRSVADVSPPRARPRARSPTPR